MSADEEKTATSQQCLLFLNSFLILCVLFWLAFVPLSISETKTTVMDQRCVPVPASSSILREGQILLQGEALKSPNGRYSFEFDGSRLVISGHAVSNTAWAGPIRGPYHLVMQDDCNLVLYDTAGKAIWLRSHETATKGCYLAVQDDRNVVIYDANHKPGWESKTRV